jgi:MYXO-CTERM domain-containing protein
VFGQLDSFQNGTTMGWEEGDRSPNPPTNVASGGPDGAGDRFLRNISAGGSGRGSRMIMFNEAQWAGNYTAAGVTRIDGYLGNFGPTPLHVRLALESGAGTKFSSTRAVLLPANSGWHRASFDLTSAGLTRIAGTQSLATALSNVSTARLLSSSADPDWEGDSVAGTLGVDDLRALRLPGDTNFDGRVNAVDYRTVRQNLRDPVAAGSAGWRAGDFNFNGRVDAQDLALLRRHYGRSIPAAAAEIATADAAAVVPEPGMLAVLGVGAVLLLRRRRPF